MKLNMARILALSSSRAGNKGYLEIAFPMIKDFLGTEDLKIAFIPFASVERNYDDYTIMVRQALSGLPYRIETVTPLNAGTLLNEAAVIMVGGGNTFKLLHDIYENKLMDLICSKVRSGIPYVGWSAGSNITGISIGTTNDMPIIEPASFKALGLLPFQINPHYINQKQEGFHGETRDQRISEFLRINPGLSVVGLPEGTALRLDKNVLNYIGNAPGVFFKMDGEENPKRSEIQPGEDLSYLLG